MDPLEVFKVETTIESESEPYRDIISTIISDLAVARTIGRLHAIVKPEIMLFQMVLILRERLPEIKTIDFSNIIEGADGNEVIINISDEKYASDLLMKLWIEYGRENINQIERKKIIVNIQSQSQKDILDEVKNQKFFLTHSSQERVFTHIHSECAIKKIENLKVYDPNKSLKKKIIEMAIRVAPEGFRVRYHSFKGEEFIFVATEEIMNDEWIKEARKMLYDLKEAE